MKKSDRIQQYVTSLPAAGATWHPCYSGYFTCFNRGDYYEAHDVLEHLWLETTDANHLYYKALIQLAGGFVHLRHHHAHPEHRIHSRRLAPAARLFDLARRNLTEYAPHHLGLDVERACAIAAAQASAIRDSGGTRNPWSPDELPQLTLDP